MTLTLALALALTGYLVMGLPSRDMSREGEREGRLLPSLWSDWREGGSPRGGLTSREAWVG